VLHLSIVSVDYMRRNYAAVDISYGQMSYELLEESFAYSFADIVGRFLYVPIFVNICTL